MLEFDEIGHLTPPKAIATTLEEIKERLVLSFPLSRTRNEIFMQLVSCIDALQTEVHPAFYVFLDGSFVIEKLNPNDADLVIFIEYQVHDSFEPILGQFKNQSRFPLLDLYIERTYPLSHPYFVRYQSDVAYWRSFFTNTRRGVSKGFLTLSFKP